MPFAEKAAQTGLYNINGLLSYLKECYTNPNASQKALEHLWRIRQRENKPFTAFFPRFKRELMESDDAVWLDYFKVFYLEGALNIKITSSLITLNPDRQNYLNFIKVIQKISSRLQAFNSAFLSENRLNYKINYRVTYGINNGNHKGGDIIQWKPIRSIKVMVIGLQRRVKWVSKEKLDAHRREG